jgi:hypothetical protein
VKEVQSTSITWPKMGTFIIQPKIKEVTYQQLKSCGIKKYLHIFQPKLNNTQQLEFRVCGSVHLQIFNKTSNQMHNQSYIYFFVA